MPLYNSSEVFVPAKQYGNTIHSPWILKRLNITHNVPSPLFSLFLPHFFSIARHLVGLILVRRVFRKAFRILGLGERNLHGRLLAAQGRMG